MKILEITPFASPNIGGAETHLDKLVRFLSKRGHEVVVSTYQPLTTSVKAPKVEEREGGLFYRQWWFGQGWFTRLEAWPFPFVFVYLFPGLLWNSVKVAWKHRDIDVIHAHGLVAAVVAVLLRAFTITPIRIVASTHAIYGLKDRPILARVLRWLFREFDWVLAVGEPSMIELAEHAGVERICVHPNWVDTEFWVPGPSHGLPHFLFAGRAIEKKGIKQFQQAMDMLCKDARAVIQICPYYIATEETPENLRSIYQWTGITILPSQYPEGFSAVVCESLACGTPVMVPRDGVMPSILTDEVAVFLPPKPTADDIVKAIREYKPRDRAKCRAYAVEHFSERNAEIIERALTP